MRTLLLGLLILQVLSVRATDSTFTWQQWKKTWVIENPDNFLIHPQTNDLIQTVEVLDMRSETSMIGLYTNQTQQPYAIKWSISPGNFFRQKLANGTTGLPLLFVIKHFWINEVNTTVSTGRKTEQFSRDLTIIHNPKANTVSATKMKCAIDVFVKMGDDAYCTLVRIDTLLTDLKRVDHNTEVVLSQAISVISQKVAGGIRIGQYKSRKPISIGTILDSYNSIFNLPVLNSSKRKRGIYLSWENFKNDQLSDAEFTIQNNEKEPPTLHIKDEAGRKALASDIYAVCDGSKTYKVQDGYVFEMFYEPHCIYWVGIEKQNVKTKSIPILLPGPGFYMFGSEAVGTKVNFLFTPYLMNIETGQKY